MVHIIVLFDLGHVLSKKIGAQHCTARNSKWRPRVWYGHTNFFPMGDNYKILSSAMGFSYIKKIIFMVRGCPMGPGGLFGSL